ncbi:DUF3022 domain-containing protein [Paraburkholderia sp. BCC1885]|uniref:DUF3022 domain-containing protein n=1 Tax=Paraburkholderia sp. BCC1885 TaxID=2562669 RepID=UPI001183B878|nr:DUF3022 domain-containing protein [Paraburkholderia sp. BCC1885]
MDQPERQQRIEELELAVAGIFESPKAPTISVTDEESVLYLQISWVIKSDADTTLDSRCVCTIRFTGAQIDRYAAMDTAQRLHVQQRLKELARERFAAANAAGSLQDDCALEFAAGDDLLDVPDEPNVEKY